jgi:hypothetical protein
MLDDSGEQRDARTKQEPREDDQDEGRRRQRCHEVSANSLGVGTLPGG